MSNKSKILIQVDPDPQASTFDSVVAIDAGVDHLLVHEGVREADVEGLVHGAIFTRGVNDLSQTALFFGGSNVTDAEVLVAKAKATFFGRMQVSIMADPSGANTTAAAAVLSAMKHVEFAGKEITVLGGTGPVGMRIAQLIAGPATNGTAEAINVCSRNLSKAQEVCALIAESVPDANLVPTETSTPKLLSDSIHNADAVFAAGAAGMELLGEGWQKTPNLQVAIDLNGVPPAGISGVNVSDHGEKRGDIICYGAVGIGGLKMKIHKHCIQKLYESNKHTLEVEEIFAIGQQF